MLDMHVDTWGLGLEFSLVVHTPFESHPTSAKFLRGVVEESTQYGTAQGEKDNGYYQLSTGSCHEVGQRYARLLRPRNSETLTIFSSSHTGIQVHP